MPGVPVMTPRMAEKETPVGKFEIPPGKVAAVAKFCMYDWVATTRDPPDVARKPIWEPALAVAVDSCTLLLTSTCTPSYCIPLHGVAN